MGGATDLANCLRREGRLGEIILQTDDQRRLQESPRVQGSPRSPGKVQVEEMLQRQNCARMRVLHGQAQLGPAVDGLPLTLHLAGATIDESAGLPPIRDIGVETQHE